MAGSAVTKDDLKAAVARYASQNGLTMSESDTGGFALEPGDIIVGLDGGKVVCENKPAWIGISEILTESRSLAVPRAGRITSRSQAGSVPGSALGAVRECQSTEKATYSTGGSRKAAAAKTNIAALMEAGGSLQIVGREHTPTYLEVVARASIPDGKANRVVESSMSVWKQEYLAKKAWDWIVKVLMDEPGIVTGTDEYGMPEFKEGATIKVRISDEGKSMLVPLPAKIALWRELAREWQFAGRVCESKAYSRAADMLLRGDFQTKEELSEEQAEVDAVAEKGA